MHKYLNAIGFHDIASEREWYQILLESEKKFSGYDRIALDEYTDLCELRREYGNGIGISSCGFIDEMMKNSAENAISHIFQAVESALMLILQ